MFYMTAMSGPFETVDWQGQQIECEHCAHAGLLAKGLCAPRQACVQDRYAKRIERFFAAHRGLALDYLAHPYFEVRAVAAKYVDIFHLARMRNDPDETVRSMVALRLPQGQLHTMCTDPDREVRIRVAYRLPENELGQMMHDPDYYVRTVAAKRITQSMLPLMIHDPDSSVRIAVAERIDSGMLQAMCGDHDATVRLAVAKRLPVPRLSLLRDDDDWRVRHEVAQRIGHEHLAGLANDEDELVREAALSRLQGNSINPDNQLDPISPPTCRGMIREGVEMQPSHRANPHPGLPPARGKGQFGSNDLSGKNGDTTSWRGHGKN